MQCVKDKKKIEYNFFKLMTASRVLFPLNNKFSDDRKYKTRIVLFNS